MERIIFIGANNPETLRVMNAVRKDGSSVTFLGFIDNDPSKKGKMFLGLPVFGGYEVVKDLLAPDVRFVNLITRDCVTRYETSKRIYDLGGEFTNFVHPSVNLELVSMGVGNYIQENVVLQAGVSIGDNSSIHMGSLIGHESTIGNSTFVAHGCNVSGLVRIEDAVLVGTGASIVPRVSIGRFSVIGAGTVIIEDLPPYSVAVGNPGRVIRKVESKYAAAGLTREPESCDRTIG
jgi:sugar O-acyltransferase (sialic acid O-acetyltransferase NeuD family)